LQNQELRGVKENVVRIKRTKKMLRKFYYDLHVHPEKRGEDNIEGTIKIAEKLGWGGICLVEYFQEKKSKDFKNFSEEVSKVKKQTNLDLEIFIGAKIRGENIRREARKALQFADIILVHGGINGINRKASECWEVDILCHPESVEGEEKKIMKDFIHQKNSGLDHVIAKLLSEKKIALEINFSQVLNSRGILRVQKIGRMKQNILLARKYKVPLIITSGAGDEFSLRAPRELAAFGRTIGGMTDKEVKDAIEKNPLELIKKVEDRKNPDIILKGLEVLDWGKQEKKKEKKKMYGWY
jgi:ribonuclease P/MRP protein subunit RPP1